MMELELCYGQNNASIEKIDANEWIYKCKTSEIVSSSIYPHIRYGCISWKFEAGTHHNGKREYLMKCSGLDDELWNIDANVTFDFVKTDGTKEYSRPIHIRFNRNNPIYKYEWYYSSRGEMDKDLFSTYWPDMQVRVKINSLTGVAQWPDDYIDCEKEDGQLSDVAFIVEGKKLYANKAVLATFSPVFRAMFFSGFKESIDKEVVIKDVKHDDFQHFLAAIHSSYSFIDEDVIESLMILADRYDVGVLRENCEKFLLSSDCSLPLSNMIILAETYTLPDLHKKCMKSIDSREKLREVCKSLSDFGPMTQLAINKKMLPFI